MDMQKFLEVMSGTWIVEKCELEGNRVRVTYFSEKNPLIKWSQRPYDDESLPDVGTKCEIAFVYEKPLI